MTQRTAGLLDDLLDGVQQTLRAEQRALVADNVDALAALAERKTRSLDALRSAWRGAPDSTRRALTPALLAAQRLNDLNAALLAARSGLNRARLDALMAAAGQPLPPATYGARGEIAAGSPAPRAGATA